MPNIFIIMTKLSQLNDEIRSVSRVIDSIQTSEGEGFIVNRAFPNKFISDFRSIPAPR